MLFKCLHRSAQFNDTKYKVIKPNVATVASDHYATGNLICVISSLQTRNLMTLRLIRRCGAGHNASVNTVSSIETVIKAIT
jgi:hypothetical protein